MKKTLTAMALVTSILPLSNTSNAENETDLPELNSDNNQIDVNDDSVIRVSKDSLSATVLKDNAYLIDESGNKVESLKVGDKLQILKKLSDEPFTKVQFNGKALFIANDSIDAKSVSSTSGIDFKLESFAKVVNVKSGDTLNARSTDSTSGKVLFTLKPNAGINVIERTKNGWYKIEYYGNYGYVNSNYVELINPIIPAKKFNGYAQALSKLSAKELPCSNSKSLFDIPVNAGVYTTEKVDNNWYKIKYYDKFGYVNAKDLKILSYEEPAKPNFTVTPLDNIWSKVVCNSSIEGKKYPSSDSSTICNLVNGAGVYITGETSNGWYEIKYYNDIVYVPKENVQQLTPKITVTDFKMNGIVYNLQQNSKLNVRKQANTTSAIIATLYNDDKVNVTGKTSNNWYRVDINDTEGYVPMDNIKEFVEESKPPVEEESKPGFTVSALDMYGIVYNVTSDDVLNVRETPYYDGKLITTLENDSKVKVTGLTSNGWYQVDIDGKTGYANKKYIKEYIPETTKYKVINSNINLRTSPSWDGEAYEIATIGTTLDVINIDNGWASIYKDKKILYAPANYLESLDNPSVVEPTPPVEEPIPPVVEPTPPVEEESKPSFTVSALEMDGVVYNVASDDVLNVREIPYYDGTLITTLKNNSRVKVTGLTSNGWYQVDIDGKTGYANKKYIKEYIPETTKYKVINSNINLRTSPSWSGDIYETVNVGTVLDVIEINGDWATIYKDKKTLYAPANYLESLDNPPTVEPTPPVVEPNPPVEEESKPSFTVSALEMDGVVYNIASNDVLNVRETPYYDGNLITTLKNNTRVKVIGLTSNGWYQVEIDGKTGYANKNYIKEYIPQTTKYKVINGAINLRTSASWSGDIYETVAVGTVLDVIEINGSWATIYKDKKTLYAPANYLTTLNQDSGSNDSSSNVTTPEGNTVYTKYSYSLDEYVKVQYDKNPKYSKSEYENYINPLKCNKFEFLRIDTFRNLDVNKLNSMLSSQNAGVLIGKGQAFLDTAKKYNIDPLYFVAQSVHETGYGKSTLAKGVTITEIADVDRPIKDSNGNITGYVMIPLESPTTVYNLYGIGAQDNLPTMPNRALILGTTHAYKQGWTSIEKAIDGAGKFVSSNYVHSTKYKQNTIYKFRYNPSSTYIWHQYATTPWYSRDIAKFMDKYQDLYIDKNFTFDKPLFTNMSEYLLSSVRSANIEEYCLLGKEDITLK